MEKTDFENISDEAGQEIFAKAFDDAAEEGNSDALCYAKAYLALEEAGYKEDGGVWKKKKASMLEKAVGLLKSKKDEKETHETDCFTFGGKVVKMDAEHHLVYGWASVVEENGKPITDSHGDVIEPDELTKAAHDFILEYRKAKVMHKGASIGEIVESVVFSKDVQEALGINLNKVGWFIGLKVYDEDVWQGFKSGKLAMFSIGGHGERTEIAD